MIHISCPQVRRVGLHYVHVIDTARVVSSAGPARISAPGMMVWRSGREGSVGISPYLQ